MKVMISGGGTGGHIFPALAIADALRELVPGTEVLFVGAKGRMEMEKVPAAGYPIEGLWISGLDRKNMFRNLAFPFKLVSSLRKSARLINRFRPDVVVGVGGFASGPLLEMASRKGIPTLIQEQNSHAGLTNKLLAGKVDRICVAFEGMETYFPASKIIFTGNPVRESLLKSQWTRENARADLGLSPEQKVILSLGGSLGARTLNRMFGENTDQIRSHKNIHFIWQYGSLYEEEYRQCATAELPNVTAVKFIEDMAKMYAASDLVVARAGALTLTELAALGKAALLIPSPNVAEDHQTRNARKLVDVDAAQMLADSEAVATGIEKMVSLVHQSEVLKSLGQNIQKMYKPKAAHLIAQEIVKLGERHD